MFSHPACGRVGAWSTRARRHGSDAAALLSLVGRRARFYVLLLLRIPWTVSLRAVLLALLGFRTASRALLAK